MDGSFSISTYTSQGWAIDGGSLANPLGALSPLQLEAAYVTPANPVTGQTTQYTFLFQVLSDIPQGAYFEIVLPTNPTDLNVNSATPTCTSVFSSVTLTCSFSSDKITINGMFPTGNSDGQYGIVI